MGMAEQNSARVTFFRMVPRAIPPMRADKSAMGYLPTPAFQFCEALRTASSWGWYVFPPTDISLVFDGHDIAYLVDGEYQPLRAAYLPEYIDFWNQAAPTEFKGLVPPYLRIIPSRGVVQV